LFLFSKICDRIGLTRQGKGGKMKEIKDGESVLLKMRGRQKARRSGQKTAGKEVWIATDQGKRKALVYGGEPGIKKPVVIDLHGGGFVMGSPEDDDRFCQKISGQLSVVVISLDYLLAPEYPFPFGLENCYEMILYLWNHEEEFGIDREHMAVIGHSAGGNFAAALSIMAKRRKDIKFVCQVLDYPVLDLETDPYEKFYTEGAIPPQRSEWFNDCYTKKEQRKDILCSPLLCKVQELKGLPPAVVLTCEIDSLREEGEEYVKKLMSAGVEVSGRRFLHAVHGFTINGDTKEALEAERYMIRELKKYLTVG
jgi:acetyl esterase